MTLEEMIIAHGVLSRLAPAELDELGDLLEHAPLPTPWGCQVPLRELRQRIIHELGEECQAALQLQALIL